MRNYLSIAAIFFIAGYILNEEACKAKIPALNKKFCFHVQPGNKIISIKTVFFLMCVVLEGLVSTSPFFFIENLLCIKLCTKFAA